MSLQDHKFRLKENWKGTMFLKPICEWMNQTAHLINNLRFQQPGRVLVTQDFIKLSVDDTGLQWRDFPFAAVASGADFEVFYGYFHVDGVLIKRLPTSGDTTTVTPTGSGYCYLRATRADPTDVAFVTGATAPSPADDTYYEIMICEYTLVSGVVSITKRHQLSNVYIGRSV